MEDSFYMQRALELAARGEGLTSPGAMVGAVIVNGGQVAGEGFYTYDGVDHAEVQALRRAGPNSRGATVYTNLEPCSHWGRTPPCARALIEARVSRVVMAIQDPNPAVNGRGIAMLREAGIQVECGLLESEARRLNEAFVTVQEERRPFAILKLAMTLDGKIATRSGESRWITSEESRLRVQGLRHACDALLTGSGTVLADDPLLTDRSGLPRRRPLLRVVVDRRGRLFASLRLVRSGDILIFTENPELRLPPNEVIAGNCDLRWISAELARRGIQSVLLECGPDLGFAALRAGIIDKVVAFLAPRILGGREIPAIGGEGVASLATAVVLEGWTVTPVGPDLMVTAYVHRNC